MEPLRTRPLYIVRLLGEGKNLSAIAGALGVAFRTIASACNLIKGKVGTNLIKGKPGTQRLRIFDLHLKCCSGGDSAQVRMTQEEH